MKSLKHASDRGIVLKKHRLPNQNVSLSIFSERSGRIHLFAFGIRTITSRRLSHLETGNYVAFSYRNEDERFFLSETELIYGYSKIKDDPLKLRRMYVVLQFLQKILPENEAEGQLYELSLAYLKDLNNSQDLSSHSEEEYLGKALASLGYIDETTRNQPSFDPYDFVKQLTNVKLR